MSLIEEKSSEMGFRTRINALYAPEQPVLTMALQSQTMAPEKGIQDCRSKEIGDEKSWSCKRKCRRIQE